MEGDASDRLPELLEEAPSGETLVVFATHVLCQLTPDRLVHLLKLLQSLGVPSARALHRDEEERAPPAVALKQFQQVDQPVGRELTEDVGGEDHQRRATRRLHEQLRQPVARISLHEPGRLFPRDADGGAKLCVALRVLGKDQRAQPLDLVVVADVDGSLLRACNQAFRLEKSL